MQTLWNRIAQTKCGRKCSSCFSSAATCTRRTATAAFRTSTRSRHRFRVLYSSFLTAATLLDGDVKEKRRAKLLGEIEDAREELKALDESQSRRLASLSTNYGDIKELTLSGQRTWEDVLERAEQEKIARHALGFHDWKGIPLSILERFSTIELQNAFYKNINLQKLLLGEPSRQRPWPKCSVRKQKTMEWSTAKLAYRLSQEIHRRETINGLESVSGGTNEIKLPLLADTVQAEKMINKLQNFQLPLGSANIMQTPSPPAPRYSLNHQIDEEKAATLNSSLDETLKSWAAHDKDLHRLITSICHHLLASDAHPTIKTYILLARTFYDLREHGLLQLVLDAIKECKIRLDEEALSFCLDYYAESKNRKRFQELVSQMHGLGNGLRPAQVGPSATHIPGIAFDRYQFRESKIRPYPKLQNDEDLPPINNKRSASMRRVMRRVFVRAACKNQDVYYRLIKVSLQIADDKMAMDSYIDLITKGHEPTIKILIAILRHCWTQQDWRSGLRVLQKIHTIAGANLQTYRWLLRKCQDRRTYNKCLADGIRHGFISANVQYFPEQISAMETDLLLDHAREYEELLQRVKEEKISSEPPERLARWLGVISDQMAETAFEFGLLTLSDGLGSTKGFFLYARMTYYRNNVLLRVPNKENGISQISKTSHSLLDISPRTPNAVVNASGGTYEVLGQVRVPRFLEADPSSHDIYSIRPRGKQFFIWLPLLRMLYQTFREVRLTLLILARKLGDIQRSIRHRSTEGHMLAAKILSVNWISQFVRLDRDRAFAVSARFSDRSRSTRFPYPKPFAERGRQGLKDLADVEKLAVSANRSMERERREQFLNETRWKNPDFGKAFKTEIAKRRLNSERCLEDRDEKFHRETRGESSGVNRPLKKGTAERRLNGEGRCLEERNGDEKLHPETQRVVADFVKSRNKAKEAERFSGRLEGIQLRMPMVMTKNSSSHLI